MSTAGTEIITRLPPAAIVSLDNSIARADSRQVAATFGKRHADVLRSIAALLANEPRLRERNFAFTSGPTQMPGGGTREDRFCLMDRDGFALLAMGFTGARAMRWKLDFLSAFNAMEAELRRRQVPDLDDNATLKRLLLGRIERVEVLEAEVTEKTQQLAIAHQVIEHTAPAVEAYETLLDDKGCCNLANAARLLEAGQKPFFQWLRDGGYVFDHGESTLPNADYRKEGRFRVRLVHLGHGRHKEQTLVTRQGLVWLGHRWQAHLAREARDAAKARIQGELGL